MRAHLFSMVLVLSTLGTLYASEAPKAPEYFTWPEPDAAETEKLTKELKAELPATDFTIVRVGPWIVATDLPANEARVFTQNTIAKSASLIQKQLFTKAPRSEAVKVYLFKDADSYTIWNVKLFGERPTTPYGYYSRAKKALVMNIGTGGGTLIHEMVHAMAEADFSDIPSWLNEGLGSLYEACRPLPNGKMVGMTNWRLRGLMADLRAGTATKFADLLKMTTNEFYDKKRSGNNYASVRYLMQYLQELGKLETFYWRIRDGKDESPTATLLFVFDNKLTIEQIEQKCYAWVRVLGEQQKL